MTGFQRGETSVLAHGLSGGREVPIPFGFAITGAGLAVLLSFVIAAMLQKESVLRGGASGRALPAGLQRVLDATATRSVLRGMGLAGAVFFFVAAAYGPTDPNVNPAPGIAYVYFWFGLIPLSLLFGPVWKLLNPLRALHRLVAALAGIRPERGLVALPSWVGYWPAAAGRVVAAHDRSARLFPRRQAIAGQVPLLVLMVIYTVGGLSLLFAS